MLEVTGLTKHFAGITAISNVEFTLPPGTIVGLVGPNGAGKTTLFGLISAVLKPTRGQLTFNGVAINGLKPHQVCRLGIARTFQEPRTFPGMTAAEFVRVAAIFGAYHRVTQAEARHKAHELLRFMGLADVADSRAGQLSAATCRRLEIAAALATGPKLLLLDEPMAGLNPTETLAVMELIRRIRGEMGIAVFWIEHVMRAVMEVVERVIVLHHGIKIAEGPPRDISQDPKVLDAYLAKRCERGWRARGQGFGGRLRWGSSPAGGHAGRRGGRDRHPRGPQRRRQINPAEDDFGPGHARGGLFVKKLGKRLPVRLIHYDDRSDLGTGVRLYEKLATQDKVDLLLPPWGTAMNFAIAPIAERYKYPMIGVTVDSEKLRTMHRRYFLILIQQADIMSQALVDFLASIKQPANLESVAILYVGDLFGIEFSGASAPLLPVKGFEIVALKSYPLGVKDLSATLKQLKAQNVDVYIGHSYPPDGFLATAQAQEAGFSPKVFYTGVAAIFPSYRDKFGIRVKTMHAWCFGLGLAMAGITGSLLSMVFELTPDMGLPYTVTALIIIILGGLGNILGSLVGAVCLGLLEAMGEHLLGPDMKTIIIYVAFMTILLLRPRGLLGTKG